MVASLVVFEDRLPRKSDYRHYAIREAAGDGRSDDVASIAEVTRRRFLRHVADGGSGPRRRGQVAPVCLSAEPVRRRRWCALRSMPRQAVLDELGVTDVAVIGLAKRLEEVWVPSSPIR